MLLEILSALFLLLVALFAAYLIRHYVFTLTVLKDYGKTKKPTMSENVADPFSMSMLIPACDEERVIGRILQRVTEMTYPRDKMKAIVIDDASADHTGEIAESYSRTHDFIKVVHRDKNEGRRGKASALNAGLRHAQGEIIICFDADYYPQRDILEHLTEGFADPAVGAVQGRVTVLNEPKSIVTRLVALERIGGYRVDQQARDTMGLITQFGGTVGGFRRDLLERLGGWDESMLAEDTDLTFRVYLAGYRVRYVGEAESYEEAVEDWRAYWRQRYRWAKGHMQCAFKHSLAVMRDRRLRLWQRIDGLLLLNVYFMPILALVSWIVFVPLFLLRPPAWFSVAWTLIPISLYSFVGNFAPFFEAGVGAYLDGRRRALWLLSLLVITFLYNIPICAKAFVDLIISRILGKNAGQWCKTAHFGEGNSYIMNQDRILKRP